MFCPKCGTQAIDGTKFCRGCGTDLEPVTAVLSGALTLSKSKKLRHEDRREEYEKSNDPDRLQSIFITSSLTGLAFIAIALFLTFTNTIGGSVWGFWLLIPGAGSLGSGIASYFKAKRIERRNSSAGFAQNPFLPDAQTNQFLPGTTARNLSPARPALFDDFAARNTGELVAPPTSVTEHTTRHLQTFDENESFKSPQK